MPKKKVPQTFHMVGLGCAKNLVDGERMMGKLISSGLNPTKTPEEADVLIINTCGFIENAVNESIDAILEAASLKKIYNDKKLIVTGCLSERYKSDLADSIPEADIFLGTGAYDFITEAVLGNGSTRLIFPDPDEDRPLGRDKNSLVISNPHTAYLKISEGCDNCCAYCIIPKLRGKKRSRKPAQIVEEAEALVKSDVKEIILIAQDTTAYGTDLPEKPTLTQILKSVSQLSPDVLFRFLYTHPKSISKEFIDTAVSIPNVAPYFDVPIQHASNEILMKMGRGYDIQKLYKIFEYIRNKCDSVALRTTIITGFPGETYKDFDITLKFIEDIQFDHLGVFLYSDAEDIKSHFLPNHVPSKTAEYRRNKIMEIQKRISFDKNRKKIGNIYRILVETYDISKNYYIGRTFFQSPDIDGITYIKGDDITAGEFIDVRITKASDYDLYGERIER